MASGIKAYPFDEIEPKWQKYWDEHQTFRAPDPGDPNSDKPKYYILDMFPYPSASGLHVGHLEGYTATDIIARFKRMKGFNVLHPMGWDAFGLPAEQHALDTGTHPRQTTQKNVQNFKRQIQRVGFSYDWNREINTTDPKYFRWTQWIFMKLYEKGLAYEAKIPVNWCPALGTVLANEEVIDGKSERGGHPVIRKPVRQWVLKITAYAERLLSDLETLDWPEPIKEQQRNWIGKSVGAEVDFEVACHSDDGHTPGEKSDLNSKKIRVFTTRPDTLFGATYMVLAPDHPLVSKITMSDQKKSVEEYVEKATRKSDLERTDLAKEKTGVFTGAYAINPVNQKKIPIWIADYVLSTYGTGAIMAVPAHDERDFEFASTYNLPIQRVVAPIGIIGDVTKDHSKHGVLQAAREGIAKEYNEELKQAFTKDGMSVNSRTPDASFSINDLPTHKAKEKITEWLEKKGIGKKSVQYKLRDWLFSRQRYWGEPIPIIHEDGKPRLAAYDELPIVLPETNQYKPTGTGESPLADIPEWVNVKDRTGKILKRETNTMPQWAGSCWYYLRYLDPSNDKALVDIKKEKYWMPVDLYVGGAEHAVLHLLYSRFWHKVLFDCGVVSEPEPFHKLVNQGMILGEDNQKMSKSRGNVVNPDETIDAYGADSVRLYEMFMGPLEMTKPWAMQGVEGVYRFLGRVWRLFISADNKVNSNIVDREPSQAELKRLHQAIKKVTEDIDGIRLNTAISALMIFTNETLKDSEHALSTLKSFILLLAPFAPHMAEELWQKIGNNKTLAYEPWPRYDSRYLVEEEIELPVMIDGKVRGKITVPIKAPEDQIKAQALQDPKVQSWLQNREIKQIIVVPGRIVNLVLK